MVYFFRPVKIIYLHLYFHNVEYIEETRMTLLYGFFYFRQRIKGIAILQCSYMTWLLQYLP